MKLVLNTRTYERPSTIPGTAVDVMVIKCRYFEYFVFTRAVRYAVENAMMVPIIATAMAMEMELIRYLPPLRFKVLTTFLKVALRSEGYRLAKARMTKEEIGKKTIRQARAQTIYAKASRNLLSRSSKACVT